MTITRTFVGLNVDLLNPHPDVISIVDIAHHLSMINRFAGATKWPYSVAQHSLLVAKILEDQGDNILTVFWGLLHDAHEAYLGDMPTPAKQAIFGAAYDNRFYNVPSARDAIEGRLDIAIRQRFGLPDLIPQHTLIRIAEADKLALATEWPALMQGPPPPQLPAPLSIKVQAWDWHTAADAFDEKLRLIIGRFASTVSTKTQGVHP